MLTTLILLKFGFPPAEIKIETSADRQRYLEAMQKGDEGDLLPLENLISDSLKEALSDLN